MELLVSITNPAIANSKPYICKCSLEQISTLIEEYPNTIIMVQRLESFVSRPELDKNESMKS